MDLRWDWLHLVMPVPYLPTLGPLHPQALGPSLLADVLAISGSGGFLPHDKDQRWSDCKDEYVLVDEVLQDEQNTLIPTLTDRGTRTVRVHLYGTPEHRPHAVELAVKLTITHNASAAHVIWFQDAPDPVAASTRVQLRTFDRTAPAVEGIKALSAHSKAIRDTFADFADKLASEGFTFLHSQLQHVGPVLVAVRDDRVVGAIGPMKTMPDPVGSMRLLPQYFGVLPEYRGLGLGRLLWRAAMHWGGENGANYQLLQTSAGGASDRLCQSEGLTDLGFVCTAMV